ncbi:hypothetical protein RRG08_048594 [Elysia crispata]|uniref:Uncharacterized protein n=1 Tax=Elysia crispata TaxID=231223 RepID=A0AAE1DXS4_9GAST|nr:hypothetical protein RRG08_048594 [Elysia crispata]
MIYAFPTFHQLSTYVDSRKMDIDTVFAKKAFLITLLVLAIWLLTAQSCPNILDFSRDVPYEGNTTPRPGLHTVSRLHLVEE